MAASCALYAWPHLVSSMSEMKRKGHPMSVSGASKRIRLEVGRWEGITSGSHRFGGVEFKIGNREIGHVHGDSLVDVPFPKGVRDELVAASQAEPHHILPGSGWVSVR